jgi:hypothetical protein
LKSLKKIKIPKPEELNSSQLKYFMDLDVEVKEFRSLIKQIGDTVI